VQRALCIIFLITPFISFSQSSNLRVKKISVKADAIKLDTLSAVPGSFILMSHEQVVDTSAYHIDYVRAVFNWNKESDSYKKQIADLRDSATIYYRVFSFSFAQTIQHKDINRISQTSGAGANPFIYNPNESQPSFFKYEGLNKSGSISRGITFGNNQDVFVNSSLNLQMAGKLNDNVNILAAITDENIPIQPEGNTQQLQDFDKVFIQLYNDRSKLIVGDFELKRPDSYFMNFFKKAQGGLFSTSFDVGQKKEGHQQAVDRIAFSGAVSKGKFSRNTITAIEGNQGPYRLTGSNNEAFIIVLAGTEMIYLDGQVLKRGLQYDYVIDYNTAEITFTAKRLVTKESRIIAEFEYSEKSYARSLFFFNDEYESDKVKIKFNAYSEQDSKNQPLLIQLDSTRKATMANVGDSIQNAVYSTADSIPFNTNEVLYKKTDTLGYQGVYVHSTSPDSAHFRVSFSSVGQGNGDYVQDTLNSANGKVYKWLRPDTLSGVRLGSYAPVSLLITPKKQQMFTLGTDVKISKNNTAGVEVGLSNNDVNLFSTKDKRNDVGYSAKAYYQNVTPLDADTVKGWKLTSNLNYEYVGKDFKAIERFRNVEFERDWNLGANTIYSDENIASAQLTLAKLQTGNISYQLRTFQKGPQYNGLLNSAGLAASVAKFNLIAAGSLLNTKGAISNTRYYKHNADLSRAVWKLVTGVKELTERNEFKAIPVDSLMATSFFFREYAAYIRTRDTLKTHVSLNYKKRYDDGVLNNQFKPATEVDEMNLVTEFLKNPYHQLKVYSSYRILSVKDTTLAKLPTAGNAGEQQQTTGDTKTLLNRIDHNVRLGAGVVTAATYYEIGTGQERKLEFYFLQVPTGQGTYVWRDYNNDGIKQLNEFEPLQYHDTAEYIKVFTPTNQYISTRTNQFNEVLTINPAASFKSFQGSQPVITHFSDQLSVRLDKKTKNENVIRSLNPFDQKIGDSSLVSTNSSYRNTLFFNRSSVVFGADATWARAEGKSLLTNGFQSTALTTEEANARWNLTRLLLLSANYQHGDKEVAADTVVFQSKNYHLITNAGEPKLTIQPTTTFRVALSYKYSQKKNILGTAGERSVTNNIGAEMKYNTTSTGIITAKVNYIGITFNADENSTLAYDMLEGLHKGTNFTWNAAIQRSLGNSIQLSLNYDGRKSEGTKPIHTGGVQFRAYF